MASGSEYHRHQSNLDGKESSATTTREEGRASAQEAQRLTWVNQLP